VIHLGMILAIVKLSLLIFTAAVRLRMVFARVVIHALMIIHAFVVLSSIVIYTLIMLIYIMMIISARVVIIPAVTIHSSRSVAVAVMRPVAVAVMRAVARYIAHSIDGSLIVGFVVTGHPPGTRTIVALRGHSGRALR
jgi:hypothetical protein